MNDINSVVIVGRLTRDVELKYLQSGTAVGEMSIAVDRRVRNGEQTVDMVSYFDATLFGKSAERLAKYLMKGKQVALTGTLKQDRWQRDGKNFSRVRILVDDMQLLGGSQSNSGGQYRDRGREEGRRDSYVDQPDSYVDGTFPEDIPF